MKKILLTQLLFLLINAVFAQSPDFFNYQVVVRNASSELIQNQNISFRFSLIEGSVAGPDVYVETQLKLSNSYGLCNLKIGSGAPVSGNFSSISWGENSYFLKVEIDTIGGSTFQDMGTFELLSVPYALHANTASNLGGENIYIPQPDTLFAVKDHDGNIVFAVFPDGAKVYVNDMAKGNVGGFAVSGRSPTKATEEDIFKVTPDSTRIWIREDSTKGSVGGFAVSGRSPTKSIINDYFITNQDSTRIYVNDSISSKGSVGGFAVSGRSPTKGTLNPIFTSNSDSTRIFTRDTIGGFGVKNSKDGIQTSYMQLTPNNYFIGHDVATNLTTGVRNSIFGYKAGNGLKQGNDNIFIGNEAGYTTGSGSTVASDNVFIGNGAGYSTGAAAVGGKENVFIGNGAGYNTTSCVRNVFIGHEAGFENVSGQYNTYVGNNAGKNGSGGGNTILGGLAGAYNNFGNNNVAIGYVAGREMVSDNNIFIGSAAGWNNSSLIGGNIFIGPSAGEDIPDQDLRLEISNSKTLPPLIYGEFDSSRVAINGRTTNGNTFYVNGTAAGLSAWANESDLRLKKEIETIPDALSKVLSLRGVNFKWKDESKLGGELQMGFIAQEADLIIPEVVKKNTETYTMQYAPITAVLVEAIKEQQAIIETQEEKILKLENRLAEIEKMLKLSGNE